MVTEIRKLFRRFRYSVWELEGLEKKTSRALRVFYVGASDVNKNYIANLAFKKPFRETFFGRHWMLRPVRYHHDTPCDLTITEIDKTHRFKSARPCFYVPCWVDGIIDVDEALGLAETSRHVKSEVKRVRNSGYTYEVLHDRDAFAEFYKTMYLPYTRNKYGNEAALHSLETMMSRYDRSDLLLIKDGGSKIAGEVIVRSGPKKALPLCIGVLHGDLDYLKRGAVNALYYYRLLHLKSRGIQEIDIGASRGFLDDGVLRYKKKWGLRLADMRSSGFLIHRIQGTPGARAFLCSHPFLKKEGRGLCSVCFVDDASGVSVRMQKKIVSACVIRGVAQLQVLQVSDTCKPSDFSVASPVQVKVDAFMEAGEGDAIERVWQHDRCRKAVLEA